MFSAYRKLADATHEAQSTDIIIVGGGIAGILSALECAKDDKEIIIFERLPIILGASSRNQSYRLHTGLHYPDPSFITSIKCLYETVASIQKLPAHCVRMQTSRYYLMSNSLYDQAHMAKTGHLLSAAYRKLVEKNPKNKVLGEPNDFIRTVRPEEYASYVNANVSVANRDSTKTEARVIFAMDIIEPQIRIEEFRQHLLARIEEAQNIHLRTMHSVKTIMQRDDDFGYTVKVLNLDDPLNRERTFLCDAVINCSWEETENLNPPDYSTYLSKDIRNRMKASLLVQLPQSFLSQKIPTSLFCYGPYAALSVLEDGTGIMTWEPATNIGSWLPGEEPGQDVRKILSHSIELERGSGRDLTSRIICEFVKYMPCLRDATPLDIRIGYVRTPIKSIEKSEFSIYKKDSSIHLRRVGGVESLMQIFCSCYFVNEARKFTYGICNAIEVRALMRLELEYMFYWRNLIRLLAESDKEFSFTAFRAAMSTINYTLFQAFSQIDASMLPLMITILGTYRGGEILMRHQIEDMAKRNRDFQKKQSIHLLIESPHHGNVTTADAEHENEKAALTLRPGF